MNLPGFSFAINTHRFLRTGLWVGLLFTAGGIPLMADYTVSPPGERHQPRDPRESLGH